MHTVFALLCFVVVIHWLIFPHPSGLLHWHCGNLTIAPVPAKQPWWIWIHTSCEFIMNDFITTTKQSTTKPCAYFLGYTVYKNDWWRAHTSESVGNLHLIDKRSCVLRKCIVSLARNNVQYNYIFFSSKTRKDLKVSRHKCPHYIEILPVPFLHTSSPLPNVRIADASCILFLWLWKYHLLAECCGETFSDLMVIRGNQQLNSRSTSMPYEISSAILWWYPLINL